MTPITLAAGVQAAIGSHLDAPNRRIVVAEFYGRLTQVELDSRLYSVIGTGYSNPEDVVVAPDGTILMTERAGTLLRIPGPGADRGASSVKVLASGMTAPQQIALSADGLRAYVVEYTTAGGRLLRFDLGTTPAPQTVIASGLMQAVGLILAAGEQTAYVGQQSDGSIASVDLASGALTKIVTGLDAPFFLAWRDAAAQKLVVTLRDPLNQVVTIDVTAPGAAPKLVLDGLPFRPSSATILPGGDLVVCTDRDIVQYPTDVFAAPSALGMGGGGSMYEPKVSPLSGSDLAVSCDMGGLYRSTDGGAHWTMQDGRLVGGTTRFSVAYDPSQADHLVANHSVRGLHEWTAVGTTRGWAPLAPDLRAVDPSLPGRVSAAAFTPDGHALIVGTTQGLLRTDLTLAPWARTWTAITTADVPGGGSVQISDVIAIACPRGRPGVCVAADVDRVLWSVDAGLTWHVLDGNPSGSLPARPLGAPYEPSLSPVWDQATYVASRIRGVAVGASGQRTAVYATIATQVNDGQGHPTSTFGDAGVWRCELPASPSPASPPAWSNVTTGAGAGQELTTAPGSAGFSPLPLYERVAVPDGDPDTVWVSVVNSADVSAAGCWAAYRGAWSPSGGHVAWTGAYDGFQPHSTGNVTPGWVDVAEAPAALGWGFGGPAHGLGVGATAADPVLFTDEALLDRLDTFSPAHWQQRYSSPPAGAGWASTGLDVTSVWHYDVHPADRQVRLLCNTDIGLSRSADGGATWHSIPSAAPAKGQAATDVWHNVYELAFAPSAMYAAVSTQHDLPHDKELANPIGSGAVLRSDDKGASWYRVDTSGSAPFGAPVTSVVYGGPQGQQALYVAVWSNGVSTSTDGGNWSPVGSALQNRFAYRVGFDAQGRLHCLVSGPGGGLFRADPSMPGGWTELTASVSASLPAGGLYPMDFACHPTAVGTYWVCTTGVAGKADGTAWLSTNDGASWSARLTIAQTGTAYGPWLHAFGAAYDPTDATGQTVYVTTITHGTWVTTDGGATWREYQVLPFLATQRIAFDPGAPGEMVVTTFGGGAWRTTTAPAVRLLLQRIRLAAYARYVARGRVPGHEAEDWLGAQRDTLGDAIQRRAYALWQRRNGTPGGALGDWLRAERETIAALLA